MVAKTIDFVANPELGPWRRNMLFITNESVGFQRRSDALVEELVARGYAPVKVYPQSSEAANKHHTQKIVDLFDRGLNIVHFIGHGGRYIWRTGPPDLKKNHDLFTLDHLDQLKSTRRLPVVLSLTCYSAPFDHPSADSIGEKLLRLADKGAIAIFAASWRNSPSPAVGRVLVQELSRPGVTIGEAIMKAKMQGRNDLLNQTYNLIGDPAVPAATPMGELRMEVSRDGDRFEVTGRVEDEELLSGRAVVELTGQEGNVLSGDEIEISGGQFRLAVAAADTAAEATVRGARAYVWNAEAGRDAIGWAELPSAPSEGDASEKDRSAERRAERRARREAKEVGGS
jgi:hypothetical protein